MNIWQNSNSHDLFTTAGCLNKIPFRKQNVGTFENI